MADSNPKLCGNGHPQTPENTFARSDRPTRGCRLCARLRVKRHREKTSRVFTGPPCACGCGQPTRDSRHAFLAGHYRNRLGNLRHGHAPAGKPSPTYQTWVDMLKRCRRPQNISFANYGGRGIRVCERWHEFTAFLADMGEKPPRTMIDRIDNDGHYEPGNCRWATRKEQMNNRRNNRYITAFGKTQNVSAWADEMDIAWTLIYCRVFEHGWPAEDALKLPPAMGKPYRLRPDKRATSTNLK